MVSFSYLASSFCETQQVWCLDLTFSPVGKVLLRLLTSPGFSQFLNDVIFLPLGLRSSYASQHSQLGQDLRSAVSPDLHITPIYEGRTYYSPVYRSPNHGTVELQGSQTALYRTGSGGPQHSSAQFPNARAQEQEDFY